jgi:hypothetical protein
MFSIRCPLTHLPLVHLGWKELAAQRRRGQAEVGVRLAHGVHAVA